MWAIQTEVIHCPEFGIQLIYRNQNEAFKIGIAFYYFVIVFQWHTHSSFLTAVNLKLYLIANAELETICSVVVCKKYSPQFLYNNA